MTKAYKTALWLGLVPLGVGLAIFVAWMITRSSALESAGLLWINAGTICVLIGAASLIGGAKAQYQANGKAGKYAIGIILLYLFDFAGAAGCVVLGEHIETNTYRLNVTNKSALLLKDVVVQGEGLMLNFGDIPPGDSREQFAYNGRQRQVVLTARLGDKAIEHPFTAPAEAWLGQGVQVSDDGVTVSGPVD
jgi:hypothetical protein